MIRMALCILLAASIGWGDTINSSAKNPSMLAYGDQRTSNPLTAAVTEISCPGWGGDLNTLQGNAGTTACYNGAGLGNAPTGDWYFVYVTRHVNSSNFYTSQRAVGMTGSVAGTEYIRSQQSGSANVGWSVWAQVGGSSGTKWYVRHDMYTYTSPWIANTSSKAWHITVYNERQTSDCYLQGVVDPWGTVAVDLDASPYQPICNINFQVPPGRSFYVTSYMAHQYHIWVWEE